MEWSSTICHPKIKLSIDSCLDNLFRVPVTKRLNLSSRILPDSDITDMHRVNVAATNQSY